MKTPWNQPMPPELCQEHYDAGMKIIRDFIFEHCETGIPKSSAAELTDEERVAIIIMAGVPWRFDAGKIITEPCSLAKEPDGKWHIYTEGNTK